MIVKKTLAVFPLNFNQHKLNQVQILKKFLMINLTLIKLFKTHLRIYRIKILMQLMFN